VAVFLVLGAALWSQGRFKKRPGYEKAKDLAKTGDYAVIRDSLVSSDRRKCPECAEQIRIDAIKCRFCAATL
jgi:hypothetical protein